jgi:hypothetical protein
VKAIRADKLVGKGTCSGVDETMENTELVAVLDRMGITTPGEALQAAYSSEQAFLSQWLDTVEPGTPIHSELRRALRAIGVVKPRKNPGKSHSFKTGDKVAYRASALTPLDPSAHWRGVILPGVTADSWVPIRWTWPDGQTRDTWVDASLLAKVGSAAFSDRHVRDNPDTDEMHVWDAGYEAASALASSGRRIIAIELTFLPPASAAANLLGWLNKLAIKHNTDGMYWKKLYAQGAAAYAKDYGLKVSWRGVSYLRKK